MVTLSVTRSRVAAVLAGAADGLETTGWDPLQNPLMLAIDTAAGWSRPDGDRVAEELAWEAYHALTQHLFRVQVLDGEPLADWEQTAGRTPAEVLAALRGAAKAVTTP